MKNLLLKYYQSPGDTVVSTGAVYSLCTNYSSEFKVSVTGIGKKVFENFPNINFENSEFDLEILMENPLINQTHLPCHFLESYCLTLNKALNKEIKLKSFYPNIFLSLEEKIKKRNYKYWILCLPGRKTDYTVKNYPIEYIQEVINYFRGKITFIQVGEIYHNHPCIPNTINEIGKTNLRELITLIYHSEGVLTGDSLCHHIAAAFRKPCVTVASGFLPKSWIYYPTSIILSKHGTLPCCKEKSCWKARVVPLEDNDQKNKSLCKLPMFEFNEPIAKCMALIPPESIIEAIYSYYYGGVLNF